MKRVILPLRAIAITLRYLFITTLFVSGLQMTGIPASGAPLDETALEILQRSPLWRAGELSYEAAAAQLATAANLPDPELGGEFLAAPPGEENRWGAELSWGLEWPGVYGARKNESRLRGKAVEENLSAQRLETLYEIKNLLLDYILRRRKLILIEEMTLANDSLYTFAENAHNNGELTVIDLNKAQLENANLRASRIALLNEEAAIEQELAHLCGLDCTTLLQNLDLDFPPISIPALENIEGHISRYAPVRAAEAEAEAAESAEKVAKMERLPGISFGYKHAYEDGTHFNGATLGLTLPFFSARHKLAAAKAGTDEALYNVEAAREKALADVRLSVRQLETMKSLIEELRPLLFAADHGALLLKAYRNGLITILDYITERNYYAAATLQYLDLLHAAATTQTDLEKFLWK